MTKPYRMLMDWEDEVEAKEETGKNWVLERMNTIKILCPRKQMKTRQEERAVANAAHKLSNMSIEN